MEIWDGYLKDGTLAGVDLVRGEPIPEGLYHLVCEILVRHNDGDYLVMQRAFSKPNFGGYFEATAGGSALKGEDIITCAKRELLEETGIVADSLEEIGTFLSHNTIYFQFLCRTDCNKSSVSLQEGETVSYKWLTEKEFISFVNSDELIPVHKVRYADYFQKVGYIQNQKVTVSELIGRCGFYCGACPTYLAGNCLGCVDEHKEGDCYTLDCVLKNNIRFCGEGKSFPCDTILTQPHTTVLDKAWLRWKKNSNTNR